MAFQPPANAAIDVQEREAITRLRRGEIDALELFVRRYQVKAVRAAYLITQDARLAEDIVQESFLNAYAHIHQFDPNRRFEPWFLRSVCNAAIKAAQRSQRSLSLDADGPEDVDFGAMLVDTLPSPEEEAEQDEIRERVRAALGQLSPRQRAAVVQRYFFGMSEQQMAEALESPPGTVKWLLNAARDKLRSILNSERNSAL